MEKKKNKTTFDLFMEDKKQRILFNKEYNRFLLSEFVLEAMEENNLSVRKLAKKSGISPSIIQNIRSEKTTNITYNTLMSLANSLGYKLTFQKLDNAS